MTLEELKALYAEKGAMQQRVTPSEQGDIVDYIPIQYGEGWTAGEKDNRKIIDYIGQGMDATPVYDDAKPTLGGFSKQEGDYVYNYDPEGNYLGRTKWNENALKTMIQDLGPIAMAAMTMGGGAGLVGNALFGLEGAAAAGAGGALAGGLNAYGNDQDILKGALLGGAAGAGSMKLGDTGLTVGDVKKAYDLSQNPTLAGALNAASPYLPDVKAGDISLNDVLKGVGTAQALSSGDYNQIFKALTGIAKDTGNLKSSLAGFEANPEDFIEGYFQPGGEGYNALMAGNVTLPDNPEELVITGDREKPYVPSIRTKDIVSDIPDDIITADQITKLFPDLNPMDILQAVTSTTTTPGGDKTPTPSTTTTKQALQNLGLTPQEILQSSSQDPYADIKLMEEMFGPDIAYKLVSLGGNKRK